MPRTNALVVRILVASLLAGPAWRALAEEKHNPEVAGAAAEGGAADATAKYCANIAGSASDARIAWQTKRLNELAAQIKQRVAELDAKEKETRDWVQQREELLKKAEDDVVAIYSKMKPDVAAQQLVAMDESVAAAILSKLNPRASSSVLNEMDAAKAASLVSLISGKTQAAGKKS
jgi:flagellar motility protein MotE (MotC chaperone)